jgi:DNA repair exonuclease SbcCD nuclease subunit
VARPLRFVHTSDLHLDAFEGSADAYAIDRRRLIREAFAKVVETTRDLEADALLIAGDVFDSNRTRPETIAWFVEQCAAITPTPVIAINGNHDALGAVSVYRRAEQFAAANLHLVLDAPGRLVTLDALDLVVWGRAFTESDWKFRPLDGLPERADDRWHVALAHGHYVRSEQDHHRAMLIWPSEIARSGWDYFALGHWEPHADVTTDDVPAVYSGAPMPISDANTKAGHVVVVDCDSESGVSWRRVNVDPRRS